MNYFETLNAINVNGKTEQKNGLTYLSWAWAWGELKKLYPLSFYTVYEDTNGMNYFTDGKSCWVKTGVTVVTEDSKIEHIEYLPIMDFKNKSIPADSVTSFDVNKAIQRSLTKAVARHGLGLYIYAGEDLPEAEVEEQKNNRLIKIKALKEKLATAKIDEKWIAKMYKVETVDLLSEKAHDNIIQNWDKVLEKWKAEQNSKK